MSISDHYDSNVDGLNVNGRKTGSKYHLICWMFPYKISRRLSGLLSIHFYLYIIVKNSHCSRTLFSTIDSVINPSVKSSSVISSLECEKCIHFFSNKINTTQAQVYLDTTCIRSLFLLFTVEWICTCFISDKFFSSQHSSFTFSNTVGPDILCIINNCRLGQSQPVSNSLLWHQQFWNGFNLSC